MILFNFNGHALTTRDLAIAVVLAMYCNMMAVVFGAAFFSTTHVTYVYFAYGELWYEVVGLAITAPFVVKFFYDELWKKRKIE